MQASCLAVVVFLALVPSSFAQLAVNGEVAFVPSDVAPGDEFGAALDADGERAIVGAHQHDTGGLSDAGAAYVFRRVGDVWVEEAKLVVNDPGAGDELGRSVAIDGDTAVVGAWGDNTTGGIGSGSVYVFVRAGTSWTQQAKLVPGDVASGDELGYAVALDGDTILAGAPGDDLGGSNAGSVHVFVRSGTSWTRTQELLAPSALPAERLGAAVAIEGDLAGVGAPSDGSGVGSVVTFERVGGTWGGGQKLHLSFTQVGEFLGASIDMSADTLAIGAPFFSDGSVPASGRVVFLERVGSVWTFFSIVEGSDPGGYDNFAADVALAPGRAFIGEPGAAVGSAADQGIVHGFDQDTIGPGYTTYLSTLETSAGGGSALDKFGSSLAWAGEELLAGAPGAAGGSGAVYALRVREVVTTVTESQRLDLTGTGHDLGRSVALSGDTLVAGAPELISPTVGFWAGSVRIYERGQDGQWGNVIALAPSGVVGGDGFGASVDVEGERFVATGGNTAAGLGGGAAYVYRRAGTGWMPEATLTAPDATAGDGVGPVALSGNTLVVGAFGDDGPTGTLHGAVNIWVRAGTSWSHQARLQPGVTGDFLWFGRDLALDGDTLLVGTGRDRAYVYRRAGTTWTEEAQLVEASVNFGWSVDVQGDTAAVGANGDSPTGAVFVFERTGTSWARTARLVDPRPRNAHFGFSVTLDGDRLLACGFRGKQAMYREDALLFGRQAGGWVPLRRMVASSPGLHGLGSAVDMEGDTIVLGAPEPYVQPPGAVYVYDLDATFPSFCDDSDGSLAACPCGNAGAPDTGCDLAQTTGGVGLEVFGQQFEPANRATLTGSGFPSSSTPAAVVLRGASREPVPVVFGDGLRCTATPLVRVRAAFAIGGTTTHAIGHDAPSGTHYYQLWFRNTPVSYCDSMAAFNLSNGRTLVW
jgi:hypothetical protein